MLNKIILIGRLVRDPELRYTGSGTPVCNFTLAVERNYTNRDGDRDVDFIPVVTWQKLAETCAQHLGKGRLVAVDGRLQIRKSEKENRTYINPEVVAQDVRFLDWPKDGNSQNQRGRSGASSNQQFGPDSPPDSAEDMLDDDFDVPF
ncbi:single-stranded DNA-binding protein [Halanaerobiaceae bacterium Z-7014]|uniref:Single-stranded DNA-binding protein n=1 Tax=Halonatronomonas betaini TaxID=2778430 RepID=A0A931AX79_9FIRM|nr:single-stranded DNA-binding protein [Halonatronomonas betaini]MBF8437716.1 single-stranded DNA-binding protein [Halonatronomonas betaini]